MKTYTFFQNLSTLLYKLFFIGFLLLMANTTLAQIFTAADIAGDLGNSRGVAIGDVNGDGFLDIYVTNFNEQNNLWLNDGEGNFTAADITGDIGLSLEAAMADVNGDGFLDIYVANIDGQNRLWLNDGEGNFTAADIAGDVGDSYGVVIGDVSSDGFLDIYVANNGQNRLWINDGFGNFTAADITGDLGNSRGAAIGDVNGDGYIDIYVVNSGSQSNRLWLNDTEGGFIASDIVWDLDDSFGVAMGDFNGDGFLDIYVARGYPQENQLWLNDGEGNFTSADIEGDDGYSYGVAIGDVNGDGFLDIYVANYEQNNLWINDGEANFTIADITGDDVISYGAAIGDFNGDGFLDIYVANDDGQNRLWLQVPLSYTVQFLDYDNTVLDTQSVVHGNDATAPTAPTRPGYTFTGWNPVDLTNITADTDFIAGYSLIPVVTAGGARSSITAQVERLIANGDLEAADKLKAQWPQLFETNTTSETNMLEIIKNLQKQLADLIAQLKALTGREPGLTTLASTFTLGTRNLTTGDTGNDVELLQRFLLGVKYSIPAGVTGYFGTQTQSALAQFQSDAAITPALGYYGPLTRATITTLYPNVLWR